MKKTIKIVILSVIGFFFLLFIIGLIAMPSEEIKAAFKKGQEKALAEQTSANNSQESKPKKATKSRWKYSQSKDQMTGKITNYASVKARELLEFAFPYDGGSTAKITIRARGNEQEVMFSVSKGQIITGINGGVVRVKFDDETPYKIGYGLPADYSDDLIFLKNASSLIDKIKTAKKFLIEVKFYDEGNHVIEFDVQGLEWEY